ncbi:hypothetical protein T4D_8943 [Trichinella pseudospiralis]|uniref:Uncharacterized protein n=1 Tax=Trichinella pseudospiralis TaxID=6337 RepID=A0A0V1FHP3_TRIPS|nr:hypothetical protein T4D_8943 [Trichinella pseudospiralis]
MVVNRITFKKRFVLLTFRDTTYFYCSVLSVLISGVLKFVYVHNGYSAIVVDGRLRLNFFSYQRIIVVFPTWKFFASSLWNKLTTEGKTTSASLLGNDDTNA